MSISQFRHVKVVGMKTVIPKCFIDIDDEFQYLDNNSTDAASRKTAMV